MKKILITGSDGLLGSQLCKDFLKIGMKVVGIDNQNKYGKINLNFKKNKNFAFIKGDCADYKLMKRISSNCDYFIANAALVSGIKLMSLKPYDFYKKNDEISQTAIRIALELKKKSNNFKFIFISSSMVYEKNKKKYSSEIDTENISYPQNFYSFQKLSTERKILSANQQENLNYIIIRPFNIVGKGDEYLFKKSTHVIPDIIRKINKNPKVINIYGNGNQSRSFIHYKDVSQAILQSSINNKIRNEIFNVGNERQYSINEIINKILKIKKIDNLIVQKNKSFKIDVINNGANIKKIKKMLNFKLKYNIDDIIKNYSLK